jgi:hypothetical protein
MTTPTHPQAAEGALTDERCNDLILGFKKTATLAEARDFLRAWLAALPTAQGQAAPVEKEDAFGQLHEPVHVSPGVTVRTRSARHGQAAPVVPEPPRRHFLSPDMPRSEETDVSGRLAAPTAVLPDAPAESLGACPAGTGPVALRAEPVGLGASHSVPGANSNPSEA